MMLVNVDLSAVTNIPFWHRMLLVRRLYVGTEDIRELYTFNFSVNLIIITIIIIKSIDQASVSLAKKCQFHLFCTDNFFPLNLGHSLLFLHIASNLIKNQSLKTGLGN